LCGDDGFNNVETQRAARTSSPTPISSVIGPYAVTMFALAKPPAARSAAVTTPRTPTYASAADASIAVIFAPVGVPARQYANARQSSCAARAWCRAMMACVGRIRSVPRSTTTR